MRVLILAQYFPPDMGGGATRAYNVAKGLALNGCDVVVVTAFPHYPTGNIPSKYRWKPLVVEHMDGFKVFRTFIFPLASEGMFKRMLLFASFLVSSLFALPFVGKIDVVWAANPNVISVFPSLVYAVAKRCPLAQNVDDLWPEVLYDLGMNRNSLFSKLGEFLARIAYNVSSTITPISPGYVKVICRKYNVDPRKVHVVRAGVDLGKFMMGCRPPNSNEGPFRVLYSGAFSIAYDFNQVLLAAKNLEKDGVEFILQGGGELASYLKARVKELKSKNVKILDKIVSRDEVAKLLSEADALILPLRDFGAPYLGISSKLYEYLAAGKPVICCAEGEPARCVEEAKCGIVVKPGDYEGLAKAVIMLKENTKLTQEMAENGREYVKKDLSIEAIGLKMKEIFVTIHNSGVRGASPKRASSIRKC
jgi:glycosyltransferase involved in cell wall biosynthesis